MRKKIRRDITNSEPSKQRRLHLSRETVRTLGADDLAHAIGGSGCDTTSWTTETRTTTSTI
jgi:hypothetical protein